MVPPTPRFLGQARTTTHPEALDGVEGLAEDDGAPEQEEDLPKVEEAELDPRADVAPAQGVVVVVGLVLVVGVVAQAGGARLEQGPRAAEEEEGVVQLLRERARVVWYERVS